jgi:small subunit ribosomal protein S10
MYITIKSFNYKLLDFYLGKIKKNKMFNKLKVVYLPSKIKKWSVLKSPHVNSKSKEQFEMLVHSRGLVLKNFTKSEILYFENILRNNLLSGISLKIKY